MIEKMKKCKNRKVVLISFIILLLFESYFCLLSYTIIYESTNSHGNYSTSNYSYIVDEDTYMMLDLFGQDRDVSNYIENEEWRTYCYFAVPIKLNEVRVYYWYSRENSVVIPDEEPIHRGAWDIPCYISWKFSFTKWCWVITDSMEQP